MTKAERIQHLKSEGKEVFLHLKTKNVVRGKIMSFSEDTGEIELLFGAGVPGVETRSYVYLEDVEFIDEVPQEKKKRSGR
ncbi:MAG: hypothetical protein Q7K16_02625 [Candidatus Azambacteria bacterium]|nr:hypothetical protein [Candidatus Azambacteria bacterium]